MDNTKRMRTLEDDFRNFRGSRCDATYGATGPEYDENSDKIEAIEKEIATQLDEKGKKLLRELSDLEGNQSAVVMNWAYEAGLKDGFKLKELLEVV
ncbi:MAG: DUF6809 family protein [Eubacteriales bacterium]